VGDPCWSSLLLKDCNPWKKPLLEQLRKDCALREGSHTGAGEQREEE